MTGLVSLGEKLQTWGLSQGAVGVEGGVEVGGEVGVVFADPATEVFGNNADLSLIGRAGGVEFEFADVELHGFIVDEPEVLAKDGVVFIDAEVDEAIDELDR